MKEELQSILYMEEDVPLLYPQGDAMALAIGTESGNKASDKSEHRTPVTAAIPQEDDGDKTQSMFSMAEQMVQESMKNTIKRAENIVPAPTYSNEPTPAETIAGDETVGMFEVAERERGRRPEEQQENPQEEHSEKGPAPVQEAAASGNNQRLHEWVRQAYAYRADTMEEEYHSDGEMKKDSDAQNLSISDTKRNRIWKICLGLSIFSIVLMLCYSLFLLLGGAFGSGVISYREYFVCTLFLLMGCSLGISGYIIKNRKEGLSYSLLSLGGFLLLLAGFVGSLYLWSITPILFPFVMISGIIQMFVGCILHLFRREKHYSEDTNVSGSAVGTTNASAKKGTIGRVLACEAIILIIAVFFMIRASSQNDTPANGTALGETASVEPTLTAMPYPTQTPRIDIGQPAVWNSLADLNGRITAVYAGLNSPY